MPKKKKTELESAELKYQTLIDKRDAFNEEARVYRDERNALNEEKKDLIDEMSELKEERNKLVEEMRGHKNSRNEYQKQARELIEHKKKRGVKIRPNLADEIGALRTDVSTLEIKQQTTTLTLDEENKLLTTLREKIHEAKRLEELLKEQESILFDVKEIDESIDNLFKKADEEHALVVALSDESQKVHEKYVALVNEISHLINEANKKHEAFLKSREQADHYHQRAVEMLRKILSVKKEKREEWKRAMKVIEMQNIAVKKALDDEDKLKKVADEALERLLKKGKIEIG